MNKKQVSILMNCYNGEKYLTESIQSVISQTYKDWELIFWDNKSQDKSKEIVLSFNDSRIKYFLSETHSDLGYARLLAYKQVRGEYLAFLDVDDIWYPRKLEKQIILFKDSQVGICFSNTLFFSRKKQKSLYPNTIIEIPSTDSLITNYNLSLESIIIDNKKLSLLPYQFDKNYSNTSDFDLMIRMSTISKIAYYPEILSAWRVHKQSETFRDARKMYIEKINWCNFHLNHNYLANYRKSILELSDILNANSRIMDYNIHNLLSPQISLIRYSSIKNILIVIFSYIPYIPKLLINIKKLIFNFNWF